MASMEDDESWAESSADGSSSDSSSPLAGSSTHQSKHHNYASEHQPRSDASADGDGENYSESEDPDRANRFQGTSNTWRFFAQDELALAASLEQERANDLSIHLYNAHALKMRARDPQTAAKVKPYQGKKRWIKSNDDGSTAFYPDPSWTAWPLRPDRVPRKGESFGVLPILGDSSVGTYRKIEPWNRSSDLEEEIQALLLRKAKDAFRKRKWKVLSPTVTGNLESPESPVQTHRQSVEREVPEVDMSTHDTSLESEISSQASLDQNLEPDFLADDDHANDLLEPSVHHILAKLDHLLIGLHKSRKGHTRSRSARARPRSRSKDKRSISASQSRRTVNTRLQSRMSNSRSSSRDDEKENNDSAVSPASPPDADSDSSGLPERHRPLAPRDWSEVLGLAALTGWNPRVIDRTALRCSRLFNEGMRFRDTVYGAATSSPFFENENNDDGPNSTASRRFVYRCPVHRCAMHKRAFDKTWRWREHLKRVHKFSKVEVEQLEERFREEEGRLDTRREEQFTGGMPGRDDFKVKASGVAAYNEGDGNGDMLEGVDADGFMQPITLEIEDSTDDEESGSGSGSESGSGMGKEASRKRKMDWKGKERRES